MIYDLEFSIGATFSKDDTSSAINLEDDILESIPASMAIDQAEAVIK